MRRLRELDVVVVDDIDAVAPGVEKIQKPARQHLHAGRRQALRTASLSSTTNQNADHRRRLSAALLQGDELIAKIDEGGVLALAAQREFKQRP